MDHVQSSGGEMRVDIPSTEDENLSEVCDIGRDNSTDPQENENSIEVQENQEAGSLETEKENKQQNIDAVIVNIEDTGMIDQDSRKTPSIEKIELEEVKIISQKDDDLLEKPEKGKRERSNTEIRGSSIRIKKPRRSLSVREYVRQKHDLSSATQISASAPHLSVLEPSVTNTINMVLRSWLQPMDNKMNMKVFGSKRAMKDEQERYKKAGFVIHPTSSFRSVKY